MKNKQHTENIQFYAIIGLLITVLLIFLTSCSTVKLVNEKAYISTQVCEQVNGTFYDFVNLTYTEGKQFFLPELPQCKTGDTIKIKTYRSFWGKKVVFVKFE